MNQNVEVGQGNLKLRYSEEGVKITRHLSTKNQVTAEQSYAYYIGSNGTDKDPQVAQLFNRYNLIYLAIILMCV